MNADHRGLAFMQGGVFGEQRGHMGIRSHAEHQHVELGDVVLMLGVGPDAHVASLFPEHPALHEREASVIGVHGAPKPPPLRVSMTFPSLCAARDVWFLVSGAAKSGAVGLALSGAGEMQAPAAGVSGIRLSLIHI